MTFQKGNTFSRMNRDNKPSAEFLKSIERRRNKNYETIFGEAKAAEIKQKIGVSLKKAYSEGRKKMVMSEDHKKKLLQSLKGNKFRLGKTFSAESINKMRSSHKGQIAWNKGKHWSQEFKEKQSERIKHAWQNPKFREREVLTHKGRKLSEEWKKKISLGLKNRPPVSEEARRKISLAKIGKKLSASHKLNLIRAFQRPETIEKKSKISKELWKNEGYREKTTKAMLKGLFKRPTSFESQIIQLINKYNLPFKYTGDGKILICHRNPDFIDCNDMKLLIEVYCSFWHPSDYEEQRDNIFSKYGYRTLFLSEKDILDKNWEEVCLSKINNFIGMKTEVFHG